MKVGNIVFIFKNWFFAFFIGIIPRLNTLKIVFFFILVYKIINNFQIADLYNNNHISKAIILFL